MKHLSFFLVNVLQTLLRVLPFPCKTGLVKIGNPGRNAPVFLTCNFRLTVERVRRALAGIDAYLLVANSRGVNVWCAATGGLLTNHDVVSVLKTSGIADLVDHRQVILPQLAATGIEGKTIHKKTGWQVIWGPVYAASIPAFLGGGMEKTVEMRSVRFPWPQRLEMAVAWAFPISLFVSLLVFPFWREGVLPLVGFVWGWAFLLFLSFPLYQRCLGTPGKRVGLIFFDFGSRGVPLFLWLLFLLGLVGCTKLSGDFSWALTIRWGLASLVVGLLLGLDLMGSTPVYKSGLHEDRLLRIVLDAERCKGAAFCEEVCPTNVFEVDHHRRLALLPRAGQCVQCGACIVQCPFDALSFHSPKGDVVAPDTVRRFKLNMLGKRKSVAHGTDLREHPMMPSPIEQFLDLLDEQREAIFGELGALPDAMLWYRPGPKVWSIGEHLDHTRVINCCARRLMIVYFPLASIFARPFRRRSYPAEIDDVYKRPGFPMNVGWLWPPKYTPRRRVSVDFLHEALRAEHAAFRRFFTAHDEQLLGHTVLVDPVIGALNLVQWLRVQAYHDAHHYERVRVRINDPEYANRAVAAEKHLRA